MKTVDSTSTLSNTCPWEARTEGGITGLASEEAKLPEILKYASLQTQGHAAVPYGLKIPSSPHSSHSSVKKCYFGKEMNNGNSTVKAWGIQQTKEKLLFLRMSQIGNCGLF